MPDDYAWEVRVGLKFSAIVLLLSVPMYGSVTLCTDISSWAAAATDEPNVVLEPATIANGQFDSTDLTITSVSSFGTVTTPGNAQFINNLFTDCVGKDACNGLLNDTTTFTFDKPTYGFSGNFAVQGGTSPDGLEIYISGNGPTAISPNGNSKYDFVNFFGFASTTPFTSFTMAASYGSESYTIQNMLFAIDPPVTSPEPSSLAILGLLCLGVGIVRRRFNR